MTPQSEVRPSETEQGARELLDQQVPIRFPENLAAAARYFADQESMTVSAWIRRIVDRELAARNGKCPTCGHAVDSVGP